MLLDEQKRNEVRSHKLKLKLALKGIMPKTQSCSKIEKIATSINFKKQFSENQETVAEYEELSPPKLEHNVSVDQKLSEFFQVKEKIGAGAQAVVHRCIEKSTGKEFSVKLIKRCGAQVLSSIKETYKLLNQLDHPNIIKVKNLFIQQENKKCQIVTEYFNCGDLRAYMRNLKKNGKKMGESQVIKIIQSIFQTLDYLKQKRVCHRDIKPENILYDPKTRKIKLIDFDVARININSEEPMDLWTDTGSLYYRAPESFVGGYDEKVDAWSAGVIAYEILFGHLPFFNQDKETAKNNIRIQELQLKHKNISETCKNFIFGLLNKDRQHRLTPKEALSHPYLGASKGNFFQQLTISICSNNQWTEHYQEHEIQLNQFVRLRQTTSPS